MNENWPGFLLILTAQTEEEFFIGYQMCHVGTRPRTTWKDVTCESYSRNKYKPKKSRKDKCRISI